MDKGLSHEQNMQKPKNNQHLKTSNNNFETFNSPKHVLNIVKDSSVMHVAKSPDYHPRVTQNFKFR